MQSDSSKIENVIEALSEMEGELDSIKANAEDVKRELIAMARDEAERLKASMIDDANSQMEKDIEDVVKKSDKNAVVMISKANDDVKKLKKQTDSRFDKAVQSVVLALLGE